jgi:hypothetical protein
LAVNGKILPGKPGKVADHRKLIRFGEVQVLPEQVFRQGALGNVGLGQDNPPAAVNAFFIDKGNQGFFHG